ncbi:hypothetical protein [Kribbella deserti]|uniref:Uncharacterized protein n=1 Tax=Kribbella deserti TaxID=1926257 RepID=A0ABV6QUR9_9ACTN
MRDVRSNPDWEAHAAEELPGWEWGDDLHEGALPHIARRTEPS